MNKYLRKEIIKNTIYIGLILIFAAFATYKIYNKFQTTRDVDYTSKSLDVVYHDNGDKITIEKVTPMTDSVGLSSKGYNLSLKNNLTVPVEYKIKIVDDKEANEIDKETLVPKDDIKISIKEGKSTNKIYNLNDLEKGILLESKVPAISTIDIVVRVWINKDSTIQPGSDLKYHGIIQVIEDGSIAKTK